MRQEALQKVNDICRRIEGLLHVAELHKIEPVTPGELEAFQSWKMAELSRANDAAIALHYFLEDFGKNLPAEAIDEIRDIMDALAVDPPGGCAKSGDQKEN